jgi:predicted metal-dependent hydrolase
MTTLTVDDLNFEVRWSNRRKTIELAVERDGLLTILAPEGTAQSTLEQFVHEKRFWIYKKLAEKDALRSPKVSKEFVNGEGFPYLGRSYRLLLVDDQDEPIKLINGRFRLRRSDVPLAKRCFIDWYMGHARPWIARRISEHADRLGKRPTGLEIRDLGFRWGSCGKSGGLNFHWATILLPPSIVEYVVVHELVHLIEPNHTPEFWARLERVMPDYETRKKWLAENGAGYLAL